MAWRKLSPLGELPSDRAAHSCEIIDNKMYIFGGWNGQMALDDLYIYDIQSNKFDKYNDDTPQDSNNQIKPLQRNNHTTVVVGKKMFMHGGHDGNTWLNDLHILITQPKLQWTKPNVIGNIPSPRACHSLSKVNKKLYMFGGYDGNQCFDELIILDLDNFEWKIPQIKGKKPAARNAHSMTVYGNKLILFGGHSGSCHLQDINIFDTDLLEWQQPNQINKPPKGVRGHTANLLGSNIYIFGGYDGEGRSNKLHIYQIDSNRFISPPILSELEGGKFPSPRQRHTACTFENDKIYIYGGFDGNKWLNEIYLLDIGLIEEKTMYFENMKNMSNNLKNNLFNNEQFADCVFIVQGLNIYAHKAILAAQSEIFMSQFSLQSQIMSDSQQQQQQQQQNNIQKYNEIQNIVINEWSYESFKYFLEFIYSGYIFHQSINQNVLVELLGLSDAYMIDGLKFLCQKSLIKHLNLNNACDLLIISQKYTSRELKKNSLEFILKRFNEIYQTKQYEKLELYPELLKEVSRNVFNNVNLKEI